MDNIMNEAKESIREGIESERLKMNEKYDKDKETLERLDNIPEALYELSNVYGNTTSRKRLMIKILNSYLKADFFKDACIEEGVNNVFFNGDNYSVAFPSSRSRTITVARGESPCWPGPEPLGINDDCVKFNELWVHYKETGEDYEAVLEAYSKLTMKKTGGIIYKIRLNMTTKVEDYALKNQEAIEKAIKRKHKWDIDVLTYENQEVEFRKLLSDLRNDLEEFKNNDWSIKYESLGELLSNNKDVII